LEIAFGFVSFVQNSHEPVALSRAQSSIRVFILKILTNFGWGCTKAGYVCSIMALNSATSCCPEVGKQYSCQ
jgi:hypothetical protein